MYRGVALIILLIIMLLLLYVPVELEYNLVSVGSVQPSEVWKLTQDGSGNLLSSYQDNKSGIVRKLASWQFDRGDLASMEVSVSNEPNAIVHTNDTIVRMYSALVKQQLLELETELRTAQAEQLSLTTGEKSPLVQEAITKLQFKQTALSLREKEFNIAKQLLQEGVIAQVAFNTAENNLALARIEVETAQKNIDNLSTGVKTEMAGVNDAKIIALEKRLALLRQRNTGLIITATFDAIVQPVIDPSVEVLTLHHVNDFVVTIPVKTEELRYIDTTTTFELFDPTTRKIYPLHYHSTSQQAEIVGGRSVVFVKTILHITSPKEMPTLGLGATCTVHCKRIHQREYLRRLLNFSIG